MLQKEQASGIIIDKITLCLHDSNIAFRKIEKITLCIHDSHVPSLHLIQTKITELAMYIMTSYDISRTADLQYSAQQDVYRIICGHRCPAQRLN